MCLWICVHTTKQDFMLSGTITDMTGPSAGPPSLLLVHNFAGSLEHDFIKKHHGTGSQTGIQFKSNMLPSPRGTLLCPISWPPCGPDLLFFLNYAALWHMRAPWLCEVHSGVL